MPERYLALKRKFMREGMSEKEAEKHGARIYNATRKPGEKPVTRNSK